VNFAISPYTVEMSVDLPCSRCGYDLRAQPQDGQCPECGASVAESRRLAAIPPRPAWRESDPRWRRRMIAGAWILVLVPLMNALEVFGWSSSVPVPTPFDFRGTVRTLDETFLGSTSVYEPLIYCIGAVLLFSKERGRRAGPLDWTRRWGVRCCYVVLLLSAAEVLFISALVLTGIAAVFQSMPLKYQPAVTQLFVDLSTGYLRYGAQPTETSGMVLVAFSSVAMLLACVPLFDALRSSGPRRLAAILVAPLALFALLHLAQAGRYFVGLSSGTSADVFRYRAFFWSEILFHIDGRLAGLGMSTAAPGDYFVEAAKWCIVLAIAVWLSIARLAVWWQGRRSKTDVEGSA
jgi:hypothetical protein